MYKLIATELEMVIKSHDIYELWKFIVSNKNLEYLFLIDYDPITTDEFLKTFLYQTKNYQDYLRLYRCLKPIKSIHDYGKISTAF